MARWVTWAYKWRDKISSGFYDKLESQGKLIQEDIQPKIEPYLFYRDAFVELSTCKYNNESPIPFTSIKEYFTIYGEGEDFEDFLFVIRAMDNALLDQVHKKNLKEKENGNNSNTKHQHPNGHKG